MNIPYITSILLKFFAKYRLVHDEEDFDWLSDWSDQKKKKSLLYWKQLAIKKQWNKQSCSCSLEKTQLSTTYNLGTKDSSFFLMHLRWLLFLCKYIDFVYELA